MSIGAPQVGHSGRRWARVEAPGGRLNEQDIVTVAGGGDDGAAVKFPVEVGPASSEKERMSLRLVYRRCLATSRCVRTASPPSDLTAGRDYVSPGPQTTTRHTA